VLPARPPDLDQNALPVNPVEAGRQSSGNLPAIRMAAMSE
jgi:hypothetical protein